MSDTYKFLPKPMKRSIDLFDVETFDYLLKKEEYARLAYMLHTIQKMKDEGDRISQFHEEVLEYPKKLWGRNAARVMYELNQLMWVWIRNGEHKPKRISKEEAIRRREQSFAHFTVLK
jgi:hypothetical protein